MDKELTPKQQTSEAVRQAGTILVMTAQRPNIDQVAAVVALSAVLRKFGKKVTSVISDDVPAGAKGLPLNLIERDLGGLRDFIMRVDLSHAEVDTLKYNIEGDKLNVHITPFAGGFSEKDVSYDYGEFHFDLVLMLGVPQYNRVDRIYSQNAELLRSAPLINIDFHRINEQYGAVNLLETSAASIAEILMALSESLQAGLIDKDIATTMLTGIMAATDRFTNQYTTAKTMTVAAQMMAAGADQQKIVRNLFKADRKSPANPPQIPGKSAEVKPQEPEPVPEPAPAPEFKPLTTEAVNPQSYDEPELPAAAIAQPAIELEPEPEATTPANASAYFPGISLESAEATEEPHTPESAETSIFDPEPLPELPPQPVQEPPSDEEEAEMEELLPPQQTSPSRASVTPTLNPTNNPILTQRKNPLE